MDSPVIKGRSLFTGLLGNTIWQLVDKVLRLIAGLFVGIWVARYLGPARFGLLNFAVAFSALFGPLADLGLQGMIVRELVNRPAARATILGSALRLRLIGGAIAACVCYACILLSRPSSSNSQILVLVVALAFLPQAWDVLDLDYQSRSNSKPVVLVRSASLLVFSAIKIVLIVQGGDVLWFAIAVVGEATLSAVCLRMMFRRQNKSLRIGKIDGAEIKYLLQASWPLAVAGLSVMLYMRIDQVMLGQILGDHAVGIFSAAVRISECWYFIPMAILASVAPTLTAAYQNSAKDYEEKLLTFIRLLSVVGVTLACTFTLLARPIIALLYGNNYEGSAPVLAIHAWAGLFVSLGVASGPWFLNNGMTKTRMVYTFVGALANIALNLLLVPRFGPVGCAYATLISYSLAAFWLNGLNRRTRPVFLLQLRALFPYSQNLK
jgi:polysaccharide transporter, PST family